MPREEQEPFVFHGKSRDIRRQPLVTTYCGNCTGVVYYDQTHCPWCGMDLRRGSAFDAPRKGEES